MATLIQSKQIEGVVTASVIQGDFLVTGNISASIISASQIIGVKYGDIDGTPNFVGGSGITITQVGDTYTFTNTGGGGVEDGVSDAASILQLNAYTASNDLVIQRFEATTSSLQTQITSLSSSLSNIEIGTTDFSELTGVPTGLVSSSVQVLGGSDVVSGSVLRTLDGTNVLSGSKTDITHLNQFTSSIQSQVDELILSASTFITSETDSQTLTIVGDQLTISDGNTITIPTGGTIDSSSLATTGSNTFVGNQFFSGSLIPESSITDDGIHSLGSVSNPWKELYISTASLNFVNDEGVVKTLSLSDLVTFDNHVTLGSISSSAQITALGFISESVGGTSDFTQLTNVPSGLVSSSDQVLGGTGILSGSHTDITSLNEFTSSYLTDSASFDTRISNIGDHVNISNLNEFTQSAESRLSQLEAQTGSYLTSETDNQTLTIVGDQLTISDGNTITIPAGSGTSDFTQLTNVPSGLVSGSTQITDGSGIVSGSVLRTLDGTGVLSGSHTDISSLNDFTSSTDSRLTSIESTTTSLQSQIDGIQHTDVTKLNEFTSSIQSQVNSLTSATSSYLTELPSGLVSGSTQITDNSGLVSGSVLRTLDGTDVLSGSLIPGTGITIDSSSGDYVITSAGGDGDTTFDGNRAVTNTLLGDLFTDSFNAGTNGSIQEFLDAVFFPSYAPTATFTTQTSNLNTNVTADGTVIETISITDTVDDSPYVVTISGDSSDAFRVVATNADSSSWEIQSVDNLTAGTFTYDITVTDTNGASRTYSSRSVEILQATSGTFSTTGTLYIIESATTGPIYLNSNGRSGTSGGVSVSYSPNYGSQSARNFTSSNPLISINSSTGVLSVGDPIKGSGNLSGSTITTTIGWTDQYGNSGTSDITVNVTQNNAPDIVFTNTSSNLNTNNARLGGGTLVTVSFTDTESDSINYDSFQFTDTSGQLTATKSGGNYLVTANSNLSGSTNYTIGVTIEDVHGFRSNTESHTFSIVQGGIGTISGDTTMYIIESAVTNDSFRDATGFGNGNIADVDVTYPSNTGNPTVQSFSSSNPAILINSSGNMTLGVDLNGSTTQSGDTIETLITFQDQYGNIGSGSVTANVFANGAPSVTFVPTSNYDTDDATIGSTAGTITISDTESNSPYNVTLGGTDASKFDLVPQNSISSSWLVQPTTSLTADTYSIDITATDNFGKSSTLSNKSIVVDAVATGGTVYVYTLPIEGDYNNVNGITGNSSDVPPVPTVATTYGFFNEFVNDGGLGSDMSVSYGSNYIATLRGSSSGNNLDDALSTIAAISINSSERIYAIFPADSPMSGIPSTLSTVDPGSNSNSGEYVVFVSADGTFQDSTGGLGNDIKFANIHKVTLSSPVDGYSDWIVVGTEDKFNGSTAYMRIVPSSGSAPS